MTPQKVARTASAMVWGAVALVFGVAIAITGISALPSAGGLLTLLVGLAVVGLAYASHRVTCMGVDYLFRPRR